MLLKMLHIVAAVVVLAVIFVVASISIIIAIPLYFFEKLLEFFGAKPPKLSAALGLPHGFFGVPLEPPTLPPEVHRIRPHFVVRNASSKPQIVIEALPVEANYDSIEGHSSRSVWGLPPPSELSSRGPSARKEHFLE